MIKNTTEKALVYRWLIFSLLAVAYILVYFHRFAIPLIAVDLDRAFKPSASLLGLLGSAYFLCYTLMQFPAGLLSDSLGPRKCVTVFLIIASVGSILFGMATDIGMAILARALIGIGVSMVFIPTMKILSKWYLPAEFSFMAGIMNATGGIGMLISTAPLALMLSVFGWRNSFILIGIITILLSSLAWLIIRDSPKDMGWPTIAKIKNQELAQPITAKPKSLLEGVKSVISEKYFWPIALWFFFDCGIFFGFGAVWSGQYLMHVYGMMQSEAGLILSSIAIGMIAGSPLMSILSDRVFRSRKRLLLIASIGLITDLFILYKSPVGLSTPLLLFLFFLFSICSSAIVVIGFTTTKELFPIEIAGTSIGAVNFFPFLGGALFPPILGYILDRYPKSPAHGYPVNAYRSIFLVLLCTAGLTFICALCTKDTFYKKI